MALIALLSMLTLLRAQGAPLTPIARVTWNYPGGPGVILGADPRGVGLDVGRSGPRPFVAFQGEWESGRVDVGVRNTVDIVIPVASLGVSGSVLRRWDSGSTYAGARVWAGKSLITVSCGLYERFRGEDGEDWLVSAGIGVGTL